MQPLLVQISASRGCGAKPHGLWTGKTEQVECNNAGFEIDAPSILDDMGKETTSIFSGVLTNASKLVGVDGLLHSTYDLTSCG